MDYSDLHDLVADARKSGLNVVIQCLPKTGSTTVAAALQNEQAAHELEMNAILSLARMRSRPNFQQNRQEWLKGRMERLRGRVDVCTALALVLADADDDQLKKMGLARIRLNRSLRPWLRSITNWSTIHKANAYRQSWNKAYREFVTRTDPDISKGMPLELTNIDTTIRFWIPVWIAYQHTLFRLGPSKYPTILTDSLRLGFHANASTFSKDYDIDFSRRIPDLPSLEEDETRNILHTNDIRQWWLSFSETHISK